MLWIILGVIIFVGLTILLSKSFIFGSVTFTDDILPASVISLFVILFYTLFVCFVIIDSIGYNYEGEVDYTKTSTQEIICLKDNADNQGQYFLFSGSIDEELYYYYMYNDEFGVTNDKILAKNCYINYTNDNFRIEEYNGKCKNRFLGFWLGLDVGLKTKYKIYIPENSITVENTYNIDLE